MSKLNQAIPSLALMFISLTSWQSLPASLARAATPNSSNSLLLADNNGICSFINASDVNIRSGPGTEFPVIANLKIGDGVVAVIKKDKWVQISGKVTSEPGVEPEVVQPLNGWVVNTYINGCSEDQFERWRS